MKDTKLSYFNKFDGIYMRIFIENDFYESYKVGDNSNSAIGLSKF